MCVCDCVSDCGVCVCVFFSSPHTQTRTRTTRTNFTTTNHTYPVGKEEERDGNEGREERMLCRTQIKQKRKARQEKCEG